MAPSAKLHLRQTQSIVITPQLVQAIRLLRMPAQELEHFLANELEQNPLLGELSVGPAEEGAESPLAGPDGGLSEEAPGSTEIASIVQRQEPPPGADPGFGVKRRSGSGGGDFDAGIDQRHAAVESLEQMLERRIAGFFTDAADRAVALAHLASLDETGYLTVAPEDLAARLGLGPEVAERVLRHCQELAPTGVFARTLSECLSLQLAERRRLDSPMQALLDNLDRLAAGERAALCMSCGVDFPTLDRMIAEIRSLDPKPGLAFDHEPVRTTIPDVFVRRRFDGAWAVELNDAVLPRILVDHAYYTTVSSRCRDEDDRRYLTECLQKASWLEKSLDQRARTILRVASEIVRRQERFLEDGVAYLRPLNLRMVADALAVHESTVSRAAANKTISTPRGVLEFRFFFTGSIPAAAGGEAHSAEAVKHRIRQMINSESPDEVLSDDGIMAVLSREGIEIARRTIAKYREGMGIGSSVERRRARRLKVAS